MPSFGCHTGAVKMRGTVVLAGIVVAAALLSACSTTSSGGATASPIGGDVIAPVTKNVNDLQGADVDLVIGQVLNINTGDLAVQSYWGKVADESVATFVPGREDGGAEFNPGVEAVGAGSTTVVLTNQDGGIEPVTFTVTVIPRS